MPQMEMAFQVSGLIAGISAGPRGTDAAVIFVSTHVFAFKAAVVPEIMALKVVVTLYDLVAAATRVLVLEKVRTSLLEFGLNRLVLRLDLRQRHHLHRLIFFLLF